MDEAFLCQHLNSFTTLRGRRKGWSKQREKGKGERGKQMEVGEKKDAPACGGLNSGPRPRAVSREVRLLRLVWFGARHFQVPLR